MSRYVLTPRVPDVTVVVGWDPPLDTFFAIVRSTTVTDADGQPEVFLWLGATADTIIHDVEVLKRQLRLFADIPADIEHKLRVDSD